MKITITDAFWLIQGAVFEGAQVRYMSLRSFIYSDYTYLKRTEMIERSIVDRSL